MDSLGPLQKLAQSWRDDADLLRRRGARGEADALESAACELEDALREWVTHPLTPAEAAEETGYTADHIRRLIRNEKVPNSGDDSRPKIERRHLPRKPGFGLGRPASDRVGSRSRVARTVLNSDVEDEDGER